MDETMRQNETDETEFSASQWRAIEVLAQGARAADAAQAAGVGRATVYRWLQDAGFAAALNGAKREHVASAHAGLRKLADKAVALVGEVLNNDKFHYGLRLEIALKVLKAVGADRPEPLTILDNDASRRAAAAAT